MFFNPTEDQSRASFTGAIRDSYEHGTALARQCATEAWNHKVPVLPSELNAVITTGEIVHSHAIDARTHLFSKAPYPRNLRRYNFNGLACVGGVHALARAHDYLIGHPRDIVQTVNAEVLSRLFVCGYRESLVDSIARGNTTQFRNTAVCAALLSDGAASTVVMGLSHPYAHEPLLQGQPVILDSHQLNFPQERMFAGAIMETYGQRPIIDAQLSKVAGPAVGQVVRELLAKNRLHVSDIDQFLLHPGGPKVISSIIQELQVDPEIHARISLDTLRDHGNCASVTVMEVLRRYLEANPLPERPQWLVMCGVGMEMEVGALLLRRMPRAHSSPDVI